MSAFEFDLFLSYPSEEQDWVRAHLYGPLCQSHTVEGRRPRIFFDASAEGGITAGEHWMVVLANALERSRHVVPVFSQLYFEKKMCRWELTKALELDPMGDNGKLIPLLRDATLRLPAVCSHIQAIRLDQADWFARLTKALGLSPVPEPTLLEFLDQPPEQVLVNHTLPRVRVAARRPDGSPHLVVEEIALGLDSGALRGTMTKRTSDGIAVFDDLFLPEPADGVRLVAQGAGLEPATSGRFSARAAPAPAPPPSGPRQPPDVAAVGEAVFFAQGRAIAVIGDGRVRAFAGGRSILPEPGLPLDRVRVLRRSGPWLALADWAGTVLMIHEDGRHGRWEFGHPDGGPCIPGDLAFADDGLFVGFWGGTVSLLRPDAAPRLEFAHPPGVQVLSAVEGRVYFVDCYGQLCTYQRGGRPVAVRALEERLILALRSVPGGLLAIGERKLYKLDLPSGKLYEDPLPLDAIAAVLDDTELPVLIDAQGKGIRIDGDLNRRGSFHATSGAVPTSADGGRHVVIRQPDGTSVLLDQPAGQLGRIVFQHAGPTLAVSPSGDRFALGQPDGIRLIDAPTFDRLMREGSHV
jgi:hypothetical protein